MKTTLTAITCAALSQCYAATNVVIQNTSLPTSGFPIVDNAGTPIDSNSLSLAVGTFAPGFDFGALNKDSDDQVILDAFTQTGSSAAAAPTTIAGLFNTSVADADNGNSLAGQSVFLIVQDTTAGAAQVLVFDLSATFPTQGATGDGSVPGRVLGLSDVVFGNGEGVTVDQSGYPAPLQTAAFGTGIAFDTIPEPSTSLLAALAGLGLVARRRR